MINANVVDFTNTSTNGQTYFWTFGDLTSSTSQNPTHTYSNLGTYTVCLTATGSNGCTDTICQSITITSVGIADISIDHQVEIYPNPVQDLMKIRFNKSSAGKNWTILLTDMLGQVVEEKSFENVMQNSDYSINVSGIAPGSYTLVLKNTEQSFQTRIIKQ
ncbi:MAG: T9SS type A sorting domain-containing protein [Bacteroidetes bacterium]|nr:T9SS type A sorting domain-containing protein [Bacteroidota bacterium]